MTTISLSDVLEFAGALAALVALWTFLSPRFRARTHWLGVIASRDPTFKAFYSTLTPPDLTDFHGITKVLGAVAGLLLMVSVVASWFFLPFYWTVLPASVVAIVVGGAQELLNPAHQANDDRSARAVPPWLYPSKSRGKPIEAYREYLSVSKLFQACAGFVSMIAVVYILGWGTQSNGVQSLEAGVLGLFVLFFVASLVKSYFVMIASQARMFDDAMAAGGAAVQVEVHTDPPIPGVGSSTGRVVSIGSALILLRSDQAFLEVKWSDIRRIAFLPPEELPDD